MGTKKKTCWKTRIRVREASSLLRRECCHIIPLVLIATNSLPYRPAGANALGKTKARVRSRVSFVLSPRPQEKGEMRVSTLRDVVLGHVGLRRVESRFLCFVESEGGKSLGACEIKAGGNELFTLSHARVPMPNERNQLWRRAKSQSRTFPSEYDAACDFAASPPAGTRSSGV